MARLKDLVYRSALRRGAGETEIAAPPHVFEVTDLLIPAGTDWSNGGNPLGTFSISPYQFVSAKFFMELAPGHVDTLQLVVDDFGAWGPNTMSITMSVLDGAVQGSGMLTAHIGEVAWGNSVDAVDAFGNNSIDIVPSFARGFDPTPLADPFTFHIYLRTPSGATTEDITLVRARAAFLVI